jgi:peptidoglycan/LPS O-acetylase OafA/YrhL
MLAIAGEQAMLDKITLGRRKIPALTGIRGVAACWVVVYHFCTMAARLPVLLDVQNTPIINRGYLGVDMFFILSGFVLTLTNSSVAQFRNSRSTAKFLIGRVFRVFPLHWCVLLCFLMVVPFMEAGWPAQDLHPAKNFVLTVLLMQSWAHLPLVWNAPAWSLSDELLAYFAFPFLMSGVCRVNHRWLALALALGAFATLGGLCALTKTVGLDHTEGLGMIRCFLEFPAGMLLCRMIQMKPLTRQEAACCLTGGAALLAIAMFNESLDALALPAFSMLILSCASEGKLPAAIFGNVLVHFLGEISFSIYLIHSLFLEIAGRIANVYAPGSGLARLSILSVAVLAIFPIAYLTWRFIEVKGQALGRTFINKTASNPASLILLLFQNRDGHNKAGPEPEA